MVRAFSAGGPHRSHDGRPQAAILGPETPHVEVIGVDFGRAICADDRGPFGGNRPLRLGPFQAGHDVKAIRLKSLKKGPSYRSFKWARPFWRTVSSKHSSCMRS